MDHIFVVLHWGEERVHYPTPDQIAVAHLAIDLGASAIIGMHPHAIQGIESYKGGFVCYSLGNFIFAEAEREQLVGERQVRWTSTLLAPEKESVGVEFTLTKTTISVNAVRAFKLDKYFLPNNVRLNQLHANLSKIDQETEAYVMKNSGLARKIDGPQLVVKWSGAQYQVRYLLKPIRGRPASVRLRRFRIARAKAQRYLLEFFKAER